MTFSKVTGPLLLNTDAFHMAARANMTDEAPVAFLKFSMSLLVLTKSKEPPLQERYLITTFTDFLPTGVGKKSDNYCHSKIDFIHQIIELLE